MIHVIALFFNTAIDGNVFFPIGAHQDGHRIHFRNQILDGSTLTGALLAVSFLGQSGSFGHVIDQNIGLQGHRVHF